MSRAWRNPHHCMDSSCIGAWEVMCVESRDDMDICGWRSCTRQPIESWNHGCFHQHQWIARGQRLSWLHVTFIDIKTT